MCTHHTHTYTTSSTTSFCNTFFGALQTVVLSNLHLVISRRTGFTRGLPSTRLIVSRWARLAICLTSFRLVMACCTLGTGGVGIQHRPTHQVSSGCWVLPRETFNCMGVGGGCTYACCIHVLKNNSATACTRTGIS